MAVYGAAKGLHSTTTCNQDVGGNAPQHQPFVIGEKPQGFDQDRSHQMRRRYRHDHARVSLALDDVMGDKGNITEEFAQELIDQFVIKLRMVRHLRMQSYNDIFAGDPTKKLETRPSGRVRILSQAVRLLCGMLCYRVPREWTFTSLQLLCFGQTAHL